MYHPLRSTPHGVASQYASPHQSVHPCVRAAHPQRRSCPSVYGHTHNPPIHRRAGAHSLSAAKLAAIVRRIHLKTLIARHIPQVGPFHAQLFGQPTGKRQTEADDAARITLDPLDERAAETVE